MPASDEGGAQPSAASDSGTTTPASGSARADALPLADALGEPLKRLELLLDELQARQEHVTLLLDEQRANCDGEVYAQAHKLMLRTHQYFRKLVMARKSMIELHARSGKLKARAAKVKQMTENKRLRLERSEEAITARPATGP